MHGTIRVIDKKTTTSFQLQSFEAIVLYYVVYRCIILNGIFRVELYLQPQNRLEQSQSWTQGQLVCLHHWQ